MNIRKMMIADYDGVYKLWISTPGMGLNNIDDTKEGICKYLERNPHTCFIAEEGGDIIGVIMSGHDGRRGFIYHLAVALAKRKLGIGGKLLDYAMEALKREGICKVALVVYAKNQGGNSFWEKRGFTEREDLVYRNKNIIELEYIET